MTPDPVDLLDTILKRNGADFDTDLRKNETNRYFLFDQITDPADLDLAWSLFPAHAEIRARAAQVDSASTIHCGYRVAKQSNRCSDDELSRLLRRHIAAMHRTLKNDCYMDVMEFLEKPYTIEVVGDEVNCPTYTPGMDMMVYWDSNPLLNSLDEASGDWMGDHFSYDDLLKDILHDWAIYLTKCDEVAMYLLWPILKNVADLDPDTPVPGFDLWRYNCGQNYWIKDGDFQSGVVYVQPPWRLSTTAGK